MTEHEGVEMDLETHMMNEDRSVVPVALVEKLAFATAAVEYDHS
jgi:hypothetical protein